MQMKTASAISTGLHAAVLLWALVSFSGKTFEVTPAESLPVDLVSDKDFSEMTKGVKDAPKAEKPKPLAEKIGETKPAEEIAPKLTEKKEVKATAEKTSEPQPLPKPDPIAEKLKKQDEQKDAKTEQPLPPKKPPLMPQPKFDADKIAALLDKRAPQRTAATGAELNPTPTLGRPDGKATKLSMSELDAFRRRITDCWSPPVGLDSAQELVVIFRVQFNADGSVKRGPDVIGGRPDATGPAFAESAKRAILQCQPYTMLRKETYASWQDMELAFKPSDMFH
jgi:outer membrane biosynthesis protein TonB